MAKKFESKENAKHKEKKAKKRKTKLDPLDMIETKETRIRRKLTDEKPQAHVEKSTLEDIEITSERKDEDSPPADLPPRRKSWQRNHRHNILHHLLTPHLSWLR